MPILCLLRRSST